MGRVYNSLKNVKVNLMGQIVNMAFKFVCRTVFIYVLGQEFLGISSLYTNILTLLSVSELGFSSAIMFSLYRPLAENDTDKINSIMRFYKNAYRIIGVIILGTGLCIIPFLPVLMNGTTDQVNIYFYYMLYLAQTVVSYFFFAYKQTLLLADQKKYKVDFITYGVQVAMSLLQMVALLIWGSFLVFTVLSIVANIVTNLLIALAVDKQYPFLKNNASKLPKDDTKTIFTQVKAMFLYKICNMVGVATDNLIISSHISVLLVGLYSNYLLIISVLQSVLSSVLQAFVGSLGNLYVLESDKKNEQVFRCLNLVNLWFIIFASVSCLVLFQPFITLWIGEEYLFENIVVFIIVMNFATNYMQAVIQIYKDTTGLFVRGKYRPLATVILNLGLSLILVRCMGIAGVFLGSIISRMCTTWAYDGWLIHRHAFHTSPKRFYLDSMASAGLIVVLTAAIQGICYLISVPDNWGGFVIRAVLCIVVSNVVLMLVYRKREEYAIVADKLREIIHKKLKRKGARLS